MTSGDACERDQLAKLGVTVKYDTFRPGLIHFTFDHSLPLFFFFLVSWLPISTFSRIKITLLHKHILIKMYQYVL